MKISKISIVVGVASILWLTMAIERWWFDYHDVSQLLLAVIIGLMGLGGAYVYNFMKRSDAHFRENDKKYTALLEWWTKQNLTDEYTDF